MSEQLTLAVPEAQSNTEPLAVDHLAEGLQYLGVESIGAEEVDAMLEHATPDSFLAGLDYVHSAVTGSVEKPDHSESTSVVQKEYDGQSVVSQLLLAPRYRREFTDYMLDKARGATGLNRKANILAYGTVMAHHFKDGNGRTARTVAAIVAEGFDPSSPDSVANIQAATVGRDGQAVRAASFVPDYSMKRSWVAEAASNTSDAHAEARIYVRDALTSETTEGQQKFVDGTKITAQLQGITDPIIKEQLRKTIQQSEFGELALVDAAKLSGMAVAEALRQIDDATAKEIISKDEDRKMAYSKYIIDIAAGESKPYYPDYGQPPNESVQLTDEYLIGYK